MKPVLLALVLAAAGLWIIGAAGPWVPRGALPDPALLAAIALGLHLPGARGLLAAWAIGWQADFLSNGPLGVFAFASLLAWIAARIGERQLALARPVALVPFTAVMTIGQVGLLGLLRVTEAARNEIAAQGYDPAFGARPVKRVIQQSIQNPLATELLRGEYPEGSIVEVDYDGDEFVFRRDDANLPVSVG